MIDNICRLYDVDRGFWYWYGAIGGYYCANKNRRVVIRELAKKEKEMMVEEEPSGLLAKVEK